MVDEVFFTRGGAKVPAVSLSHHNRFLDRLTNEVGISTAQICECAAFSMAMVVRSALHLTAEGGRSVAFVSDCLPGWVTLATARHLINGGASVILFILSESGDVGDEFEAQLKPLMAMGVTPVVVEPGKMPEDFVAVTGQAHNVLCGLSVKDSPGCDPYIEALNEASIPVHSVYAPVGMNLESGTGMSEPLFSSSTLSLGLPLDALYKGQDFVGRHYVCDVSLPQFLVESEGIEVPFLFAEQPVQQIFLTEQK